MRSSRPVRVLFVALAIISSWSTCEAFAGLHPGVGMHRAASRRTATELTNGSLLRSCTCLMFKGKNGETPRAECRAPSAPGPPRPFNGEPSLASHPSDLDSEILLPPGRSREFSRRSLADPPPNYYPTQAAAPRQRRFQAGSAGQGWRGT